MPPLREPPGMRKLMEALNTTNLSSPEVNQEMQSIWTSALLVRTLQNIWLTVNRNGNVTVESYRI